MALNGRSCRGALIVLEGLDRTGKSTQVVRIVERLKNRGVNAETMRFPDRTTALGKVIGDYLTKAKELDDRAVHLMFSANRWEKSAEILSKLNQGITLVVDRYAFSGVAFSSVKAGLSMEWCRQPDVGLPKPDLVCFLYADPEVLKNRGDYGAERYEEENFQKAVAKRYAELSDDSWVRIDAAGSQEEVTEKLMAVVEERTQQLPEKVGGLWLDEGR